MVSKTRVQSPVYFRKRLAYNTAGFASGINIGTMPAASCLRSITIYPITAFNGTGTVGVKIGTSEADDNLIAAADTDLKSTSPDHFTPATAASLAHYADESAIWVQLVDENENSSAGAFALVIEFIQDN